MINSIERRHLDRIPIDGWFRPEYWIALRRYLQVESNEEVMKLLGLDIRTVTMDPPKGFQPSYVYPVQKLSKNLENYYATIFDEWGIKREAGATHEYWHFTYHPLGHVSLDEYEFPDLDAEGRFDRAREFVKKYSGEYAVAGHALYGLFEQSWALRGYRTFIRDLYSDKSFVNKLLDRVMKWKIDQGRRFVETGIDIIQISDDLGSQTGLMLSPKIIRELLIPRYRIWVDALKKTGVYIFFHCCGKIDQIIPDLIDVGVDILNPVQPECMNPAELKGRYGKDLTFHGTISVQKTLPFGTVEDVKNEVLKRIRTVGYDGGLIIAPSHQVDKHVPIQNVLALYETAKNYKFEN